MLKYMLDPNTDINVPKDTPIFCSEIVEFVSEYRVYVAYGEIKGVCHYQGDKEQKLDMKIVEDSVKTLSLSEEGFLLTGISLDFAVQKRIEND